MQIILNHVTYSYSSKKRKSLRSNPPIVEAPALKEISFQVEEGEFIGIAGRSGSGKSTLLHILKGFLKPIEGELLLDNNNPWTQRKPELFDEVGLVFQYPEHQLFSSTVYDDVAFGPLQKWGKNENVDQIRERVEWAMSSVGLPFETFKDACPFELSGGEKRRVAIAGVLALQPKLLLLDEPTAGLDFKGRQALFKLLHRWNTELGMTILWVSHRLEDLLAHSSRLLWLDGGRLVRDDMPLDILEDDDFMQGVGMEQLDCLYMRKRLAECGFESVERPSDAQQVADSIHACLQSKVKKHLS